MIRGAISLFGGGLLVLTFIDAAPAADPNACSCGPGKTFHAGDAVFADHSMRIKISGLTTLGPGSREPGDSLERCSTLFATVETIALVLTPQPHLRRTVTKKGKYNNPCARVPGFAAGKEPDPLTDEPTPVPATNTDPAPPHAPEQELADRTGMDLFRLPPTMTQPTATRPSAVFENEPLKEGALVVVSLSPPRRRRAPEAIGILRKQLDDDPSGKWMVEIQGLRFHRVVLDSHAFVEVNQWLDGHNTEETLPQPRRKAAPLPSTYDLFLSSAGPTRVPLQEKMAQTSVSQVRSEIAEATRDLRLTPLRVLSSGDLLNDPALRTVSSTPSLTRDQCFVPDTVSPRESFSVANVELYLFNDGAQAPAGQYAVDLVLGLADGTRNRELNLTCRIWRATVSTDLIAGAERILESGFRIWRTK